MKYTRTIKLVLVALMANFSIFFAYHLTSKQNASNPPEKWTPQSKEFRTFYGWHDRFGSWTLEQLYTGKNEALALHIFTPEDIPAPRGTLFLLHGYLEHSALRVPLAIEGTAHQHLVVAFDLPGHGLSEGEAFTIGSFDEYTEAFELVLKQHDWPKPWRVIAHSTGCAVTLSYIQQNGNPFEMVIMESPLLRSYQYELSMTALPLAGLIVKTLPRRIGGISKDQAFYQLLIKDPLYPKNMPVSWCYALRDFVDTLPQWHSMDGRFIILQGDNDTVVDTAYNIPFLENKLKSLEVLTIKNGTHILLRYEGLPGDIARKKVSESWDI